MWRENTLPFSLTATKPTPMFLGVVVGIVVFVLVSFALVRVIYELDRISASISTVSTRLDKLQTMNDQLSTANRALSRANGTLSLVAQQGRTVGDAVPEVRRMLSDMHRDVRLMSRKISGSFLFRSVKAAPSR